MKEKKTNKQTKNDKDNVQNARRWRVGGARVHDGWAIR